MDKFSRLAFSNISRGLIFANAENRKISRGLIFANAHNRKISCGLIFANAKIIKNFFFNYPESTKKLKIKNPNTIAHVLNEWYHKV